MSRKSLEEKLQRRIGSAIDNVYIEVWTDEELPESLIALGVEFRDGPNFIFLGTGNDKVSIRKGQLRREAEGCQLRSLEGFSGKLLDSVEFGDDKLVLYTTGGRICIVNRDDELDLTVNDEKIV